MTKEQTDNHNEAMLHEYLREKGIPEEEWDKLPFEDKNKLLLKELRGKVPDKKQKRLSVSLSDLPDGGVVS